jgi:microcystin-dependent protein|tara:strand:+ start:156 stop:656 length:501 start_codon:yes stop_codon:yes gene_type:complete
MTPFLGQIQAFGFNFAPRGWAKCEGQLLPISQYNALFSLLGTMYGGDGRTTFGLPDLRGRSIVGTGNGPGLSTITQGEKGGVENITLTLNNLPSHTHNIGVSTSTGEEANPSGKHLGAITDGYAEDADANLAAPSNAGGGQSFNSRNPFLGINVCIALEGVYPSRN